MSYRHDYQVLEERYFTKYPAKTRASSEEDSKEERGETGAIKNDGKELQYFDTDRDSKIEDENKRLQSGRVYEKA